VTAITMGKVSRHRSAGGRGGFGLRVLFVVAAVVFAGLVVLPRGSVAADQVSFPAAQGELGSPATVITDPTATDGQAVQFNAPKPDSAGFVHPGILVDPSQLDFVENEIAESASPWTPALAAVNPFYTNLSYAGGPYATVDCSATPKSCTNVVQDAIAAYTLALLYSYSAAPDRAKYADASIAIMNAWSAKLTKANGNQARLELAWSAEVFPRAAEILRYTFASGPGDQVLNVAAFTNMLNNVYVPTLIAGDPQSNGNWELSMADGLINIGVFTDNRSVFNSGVAMWRARVPAYIYLSTDNNADGQPIAPPGGNYSNPAALTCYWLGLGTNQTNCTVPAGFTYHDGMTQETCRDMSHPMEGLGAMVNAAETARLQGVDLYGEQKQRITDAYEYAAAYDTQYLTTHVWPASPCGGQPGSHSGQGGDGTGGSSYMFGWEIAYNEYANRLGISMPNTAAMVARLRPTGGVNATDWETLTSVGASAQSGCPAPDIRSGMDTMTVTVPADGTYQLWSRVNPADSGSTSYAVQVDGGCPINIGGATMPAGQWTWADYENGDPSSTVSVSLAAGTHTLQLIGDSSGLAVDSVMFVADPTCVPVAFGDNCAPSVGGSPDKTAPTTAVTAPNDGDTVSGTVPLTATADDDTAVAHVSFLVDGSVVGDTTSAPYTLSWNSTTVPDGQHTVQSRAFDTSGNSADSEPITVTTTNADVTPPSAPSDVIATATSATSVGLTWGAATDDNGVTKYLVYRDGTQVGSSTSTTYSDTGLTELTSYSYTVYATDGAGNVGPASDPSTATTPDGTPPTAPGSFTAAASPTQVTLTWTPATDNVGVTGYVLSRNGVQISLPTGLTFTDSGLAAGISYTYALAATDAAGNLGPAATVTIAVPDVTPPTAPASLTAVAASSSQVNLTWAAATDDVGVTGYMLSRNGVQIKQLTGLTYSDTGLSLGVSYTYTVAAVDAAGNVGPAVTATTTTADLTPPTAPASLTAVVAAPNAVNLTWTAATDDVGVTGYVLSRNGVQIKQLAGLTYSDTGLTLGTSYTYAVAAVDAAGNVGPARTVTVTVGDTTPPTAPGSLTAVAASSSQVNLTWTAATDNVGVTAYVLTRGGVQISKSAALTFSDTGLAAATSYTYSVTAVDAAGNVSPAKTATVTTQAAAAPAGSGWAGEYFANTALSGAAVTRADPTVNFSWGIGSPISGIGVDNFSARWTGQLTPAKSGTYTFYTQADGGIRLYINDKLIINHWTAGANNQSTTFALTAGTAYNMRLEYFDTTGTATAQLLWSGPSVTKAVVPSTVMKSASAGLTATYFSGTTLTTTAVVRLDDTLNFSWGTGSPDSRVPVDNFSARWTGEIKPTTSASYTFYTDVAGGVRLWVNGVELVSNWTLHNLATNTGKIALTAGTSYAIKVEYQVGTQSATAKLSWSTSSAAKAIVPQSVLRDR
jgi:chitodextrinase